MKKGDKVTIKAGHGYHDFTDGIDDFKRTKEPLTGIIKDVISYSQIWVKLDNGHYVRVTGDSLQKPLCPMCEETEVDGYVLCFDCAEKKGERADRANLINRSEW